MHCNCFFATVAIFRRISRSASLSDSGANVVRVISLAYRYTVWLHLACKHPSTRLCMCACSYKVEMRTSIRKAILQVRFITAITRKTLFSISRWLPRMESPAKYCPLGLHSQSMCKGLRLVY